MIRLMLKVEKDRLNYDAAVSRARRRAKAMGVPVTVRRSDVPFPAEGDQWEIVWDDKRLPYAGAAELAMLWENERDIQETQAVVDACDESYSPRTGRMECPGGTVYVSAEFGGNRTPDLDGDSD